MPRILQEVPAVYAIKLSHGGDYYYRRGPVPHWVGVIDQSTLFRSADEAMHEKTTTLELYETTLVGLIDGAAHPSHYGREAETVNVR